MLMSFSSDTISSPNQMRDAAILNLVSAPFIGGVPATARRMIQHPRD